MTFEDKKQNLYFCRMIIQKFMFRFHNIHNLLSANKFSLKFNRFKIAWKIFNYNNKTFNLVPINKV